MSEPRRDAHGCLTAAGMRAIQDAAPGQVPLELAQHLAACARCQSRLLAASRPAAAASGTVGKLRALGYLLLAASLLAGLALAIMTMTRG